MNSVIDDFLDSLGDRACRVERNNEIQVLRKALLQLRHQLLDTGCGLDGIGSRQLICSDHRTGLSIKASGNAVVLRAQFDAGHISDPNDTSIGCFTEDDLAELLR